MTATCRLDHLGFALELSTQSPPVLRVLTPEGTDVTEALFKEPSPVHATGNLMRRAFMLIDHEVAARAVAQGAASA